MQILKIRISLIPNLIENPAAKGCFTTWFYIMLIRPKKDGDLFIFLTFCINFAGKYSVMNAASKKPVCKKRPSLLPNDALRMKCC